MSIYLKRYQNGEHERVRHELIHLGAEVCNEAVLSDARAVAQETMRRVRKNVEILIGRLSEIGFVFGYDHRLQHRLRAPLTLQQGGFYLDMFSWARQQLPVFLAAQHMEEEIAEEQVEVDIYFPPLSSEKLREGQMLHWQTLRPGLPGNMALYLDEIEQSLGPLPLSVRAWYEEVGAVNLYGYHAGWATHLQRLHTGNEHLDMLAGFLMSLCDPLQIAPIDEHFMAIVRSQKAHSPLTFVFAEDRHGKDYRSTSGTPYFFTVPDHGADARLPLEPPRWFVDYLRLCFSWGGFPGMA